MIRDVSWILEKCVYTVCIYIYTVYIGICEGRWQVAKDWLEVGNTMQ